MLNKIVIIFNTINIFLISCGFLLYKNILYKVDHNIRPNKSVLSYKSLLSLNKPNVMNTNVSNNIKVILFLSDFSSSLSMSIS